MTRTLAFSRTILLSLLFIKNVFAILYCTMCNDGSPIKPMFRDVVLDIDGNGIEYTCAGYASAAYALDRDDPKCESYYQIIGETRCGCSPPDNKPDPVNEMCPLCINYSPLPETHAPNKIDMIHLGNWEAGGITCVEARDFLTQFHLSDESCFKFQELGVRNCGCPDLIPSSAPSSSPTRFLQKKPDCASLEKGIFPSVESDSVSQVNITYFLELSLSDNTTFGEVTSPLQDAMDIVVSLLAVEGCTLSKRRLTVWSQLGDLIIHYVDFEGLSQKTDGSTSGTAKVVHSFLPGGTKKRRILDENNFLKYIVGIINDNSDEIENRVEGVEDLSASIDNKSDGSNDDENSEGDDRGDSENGDNTSVIRTRSSDTEIAIGVSVGCAVLVLVAGFFISKNGGVKKHLSKEVDRVEFLPSSALRSDQKGNERDERHSDTDSTTNRELIIASSDVIELEAALSKYERISRNITREEPCPYRDSSDSEIPSDEESEVRPISVRKKPSYSVTDTMEL